jgi:hypothetical protein
MSAAAPREAREPGAAARGFTLARQARPGWRAGVVRL